MKSSKVVKEFKTVKGKPTLTSKTVTQSKSPWFMNANQRLKRDIAKLNRSTAKSAISEVGKTVRNLGAQIAATRGYETYEASKAAGKIANSSNSVDSALRLYNQIVNGNPEETGESGDTSTTQVGGSGSAIGG